MPSGIASPNQTYTVKQLLDKFEKTPTLFDFVVDLSNCVYSSTTGQYIIYCKKTEKQLLRGLICVFIQGT